MNDKLFHLGLCMAGSISAGAYTAGVMDYLTEALQKWEQERGKEDIPDHRTVIDLLGGSSGGGITSAISLFAMQDKINHYRLENNRPVSEGRNIFWDTWVELSEQDIFEQMLAPGDISEGYVPSLMNTRFIDVVADKFKKYIHELALHNQGIPPYLCEQAELFLTLFNITGIKYQLHTKASASGAQCAFEHRDIAHFRWGDQPGADGRMELSYNQQENLESLLMAAPATGAYPIGLKARLLKRKAHYLWEHPFINKGSFKKEHIQLNEKDGYYLSMNADGGMINNEPVELMRDILLSMRKRYYKDLDKDSAPEGLTNSAVILIDPFPSLDMKLREPSELRVHIKHFAPELFSAMRSQLLFDAKKALDAYNKENYGLYLVAPSKDDTRPEYAIACGSLGGFGGFLNKDFRIHDFFLGRKNCQSFLRKYFVVNMDETGEDRKCVEAVIKGYSNEKALQRFQRTDEKGRWVPIIPEISVQGPSDIANDVNQEPYFHFDPLPEDYLLKYQRQVGKRYQNISGNLFKTGFPWNVLVNLTTLFTRKKISSQLLKYIATDFRRRKLMK